MLIEIISAGKYYLSILTDKECKVQTGWIREEIL